MGGWKLLPVLVMVVVKPFSLLLVVFAYALILAVVFLTLRHVIPACAPADTAPLTSAALHLAAAYFYVNIMFNYTACTLTSPGNPPDCRQVDFKCEEVIVVGGKLQRRYTYRVDIVPGASYRYCRACRNIKPPRAHHCSVIGACVLHYDHYCPWMFNCIGFHNYRYFYLFMLFIVVGCFFVVLLSCETVLTMHGFYRFTSFSAVDVYTQTQVNAFTQAFGVSAAALIGVGILLAWHTYLACTNQTTLEFHINLEQRQVARQSKAAYRNPFDAGSMRRNFQRVLGTDVSLLASLLPSVRDPPPPEFPFSFLDYQAANQGQTDC
jgi:palmitoyltransferase